MLFRSPLHTASSSTLHALHASIDLWHRRLGHPNKTTLSSMIQEFCIPSSSLSHDSSLCNAYQCGKHVRLHFSTSTTASSFPFELLHCDLWKSPIPSVSGFKYYLVILDDYSQLSQINILVTEVINHESLLLERSEMINFFLQIEKL